VVILDPGHGGEDPGSVGSGGLREKEVALEMALKIRDELSVYPDLEVVLTRDRDVFIPLWERGPMATRIKGDRPGIFVSIHANAVDDRRVRGVETYFLAEARTEHERRVAELENAAVRFDPGGEAPAAPSEDLDFIISELRNLDYIHWSAELADGVQDELARVHPGPDRGVKQGPFAVITNALMPGILLEVGFISHPQEEQALSDPTFQRESARAVARAIHDFFSRYPPGREVSRR
jgi:N-acetylmuramoyl-L-alanine amidase